MKFEPTLTSQIHRITGFSNGQRFDVMYEAIFRFNPGRTSSGRDTRSRR